MAGDTEPAAPVDVRSIALTVIAVLAVVFILQYAQSVLIPIVLGFLISYALSPFVALLTRIYIPRVVGSAIAVSLLVSAVALGVYTLSDEAMEIVASVPEAAQRLSSQLRARRGEPVGPLQQVQRAATEIEKAAQEASEPVRAPSGVQKVQIVEPAFAATDYLWMGGVGLVGFLGQSAIILFLVYFLLVAGDLYKRKIVKIAGPHLSQKRATLQILDDINLQIENFIRIQIFTSFVVATVTAGFLWWAGVRQPIVWGLLAGLFNSIPYIGPLVITFGLGVVTFLQFDDIVKAGYIAAATMAITSLEGYLLTPALMGKASQMNPVAIFVGLLFWSWVWGVWGTILAVPMLMMLKAICDHIENLQPVGELLGD
jgi:predicted PurR-regulated permease PerM